MSKLSKSMTRCTLYKTHSHASLTSKPFSPVCLASVRRASKCSSRRFHPFSCSTSSGSYMIMPRMAYLRSASLFSLGRSSKYHLVQIFLRFPRASQRLRNLSWLGSEIMASVDGKSPEPVHYKLYGVLYHRGASTGSRHYTVDVLHPNGDSGDGKTWLHVDDETVGAVGHRSSDNERESDQCVYMLFYCRTAPT